MSAKPFPTAARTPAVPASQFADCLAADQRRLRSLARDLRHVFGSKRDALLAESERLLERSRAAGSSMSSAMASPSA
ncbi:MAG TPA: hypothetical protein PLC86_23660, partial [Candidatus Accumulibacter phosphatis]|nr:hypothetical protein [Candidatus Accumulibacter phosphatis]